jgi:transposase-like protein
VLKLAAMVDDAECDVLACMAFPKDHRTTLHFTKPPEPLDGESARGTGAVCSLPNARAAARPRPSLILIVAEFSP